jgi:methionyl aminopeptidase
MTRDKSRGRRAAARLTERIRHPRRPAEARVPAGIKLKTPAEIDAMRAAGRIVADCFGLLAGMVEPGARLEDIDAEVARFMDERGAESLFKGYRGNPPKHPPFPGVICASIDAEVCHGIPDGRRLAEGNIIGIDIGLRYEGWCGDACITFPVGRVSELASRLLRVAEESLYAGIAAAKPGARLHEIGGAVQAHAEAQGFSVVREWGGHGLGRDLHEPPSIPHTGERNNDLVLREGMVFTIEPMINSGGAATVLAEDGWTVRTADGSLSAQFEHSIAIRAHGAEILTPWREALGR